MTLHGIDVSHYQSSLRLGSTDAQFALFKATQGTGYVDPSFRGFISQAKQEGLLWGTYHFAENDGNLMAEADHYYNEVRNYVGQGLMVLDWEHGNLGNVSGAKSWLDHVYNRTGGKVRPVIYMSQSTANGHDWSTVARDYALWVARYNDTIGPTGAWKNVLLWQYTNAHHTGGMAVDGDRFYGTAADWHRHAGADGEDPDDVWGHDIAKWAPDATGNQGSKIDAAKQLNQARGYAEDLYDRVKAVQSKQSAMGKKLDQILTGVRAEPGHPPPPSVPHQDPHHTHPSQAGEPDD